MKPAAESVLAGALPEPGASAEVQVWHVDLALDKTDLRACRACLSPDEEERADRFLRPADRARFVASHAALRLILARSLGTEARRIALASGPGGKPELAGPPSGRLQFNLSHSGEHALIGLAERVRIGVDVETARPTTDHLRIARAHFARPEIAALEALAPEALPAAFLACWTCKEAFVKALGAGLSMPLDRFTVALPPSAPALLDVDGDAAAARRWTLHAFAPAPDAVAALAVETPRAAWLLRRLSPDWTNAL